MTGLQSLAAVALTGTIASGKTTVARFFQKQGIPVISTDAIAKSMTQPHQDAYHQIIEHFGPSIVANDTLNRTVLRDIISCDSNAKQWLESLLHPRIKARLHDIVKEYQTNPEIPYVIVEIPLLFDKNDYPYVKRVLLVSSSRSVQISRIMARDKVSQAEAMLNIQGREAEYQALANDILFNDGDLSSLEKNVVTQHQLYLDYYCR